MNHFAIFTLPSETYSSVELNGRSCDKKKKKKNLSEEMLIPQKQTVRWLSLVLQQVLINVFLIFLLELKSASMS